jgi:hypothetical protein
VGRLLPWRRKLMGVETSSGVLEADHYVLRSGTNAPYL